MSQTLLISGPPGCGKTSWILNRIQSHSGPSGYLRLAGYPDEGLLQARDGCIDLAWLQDQCSGLLDLADPDQAHLSVGGSVPLHPEAAESSIAVSLAPYRQNANSAEAI